MVWQDDFPSKGPALAEPTLDDEFLLYDLFRPLSEELDEIQDSDIPGGFSRPFGSQTLGEEMQSGELNPALPLAMTVNQIERLPPNVLGSRLRPDNSTSDMYANSNTGKPPCSQVDFRPVLSSRV
jgi:hypothetical protein